MKTAMQELYADLEKFKEISDTISITDVQRMIGHYANEKEKQQIIDAYTDGGEFGFNNFGHDAENYFNQTYKNK